MDERLVDDLRRHYTECDESGCKFGCRFQFRRPTIDEIQAYVGEWAQRKGWNDKERSQGDWHSLFHTEISESYEEYRKGNEPGYIYHSNSKDSDAFKPEGMAIELADEVIRILHWFDYYGLDMNEVLRMKFAFNETRSHRHGNKVQ